MGPFPDQKISGQRRCQEEPGRKRFHKAQTAVDPAGGVRELGAFHLEHAAAQLALGEKRLLAVVQLLQFGGCKHSRSFLISERESEKGIGPFLSLFLSLTNDHTAAVA